jgi:hypothetical protein
MRLALIAFMLLLVVPAAAQDRNDRDRFYAFNDRVLDAHNAERQRLGIAPLVWSDRLAREAQQWANYQAENGIYRHAQERYGAGENLWMGTRGYFSPEDMVQAFIDERRYFRPGRFPDVSNTGNWMDVGHFTQLIWPGTQELGCAIAYGQGREYLVCRYFPAGNIMTQRVP